MNKILVIGGSGVLGSALVGELQQQAANFIIGSRHQFKADAYDQVNQAAQVPWTRVDLVTGQGLSQALTGVDTVFHLASSEGSIGRQSAETLMTRTLLKALEKSDVRHLLYSSIVGVDTIPYRYFQAKLEAEALIRRNRIPYTILRATQFHSFVDFALHKLLRLPVGFVPQQLRGQPIDVQAVAQELHRLAQLGSQQTILNLGGPEVFDLKTLVQIYRRYRPVPKLIVPIPAVGALMKSFAGGQNTCPWAASQSKTWEQYLIERYG